MKKRTVLGFLMGAAMFGNIDANAQAWQNFYDINPSPPGTTYQTGRANSVTFDPATTSYVAAGTTVDASGLEAFTLAQYDAVAGSVGSNMWTNLFEPDHTLYQSCWSTGVAELGGSGFAMVGNMSGSNGFRSVLIVADAAGNYLWHTIIGQYQVKAVVYNSTQNHIAVLAQSFGGSSANDFNYHIVVYDLAGTVQWANEYGTTEFEQPEGLYYDVTDDTYLATGSSFDASMDHQIFTMKVDAFGAWIWGDRYGDPSINEIGQDVTLAANGVDYVVTGYITTTPVEPVVMEHDKNTGAVNFYNRYSNPSLNANLPYSITQDGAGGYYLVGLNKLNTANGMLMRVAANGFGGLVSLYGQPGLPGHEILFDIVPNPNTGQFGMVGEHEFGGVLYPWVVNTLNDGRANCHKDAPVKTIPLPYVIMPAGPIGPLSPWCCETITQISSISVDIDECANPFKSGDGPESSGLFGSFNESVSPQPATNTITLRYELPQGNGGSWILRDVLGREIMTQSLSAGSKELSVSVSKLESGVYFYEYVVNGNIVAQNKLLIAR